MTARLLAVTSTILLAGGVCVAQDGKDDIKKLQGEWVVVSASALPNQAANQPVGEKVTVKDNEWTSPPFSGDKRVKLTFKLDPSKTPKEIDFMLDMDTYRGIYKIDGDTLTMCRSYKNKARPKQFKDTDAYLLVLKRAEI
jgi:uncharacterized protein (TIGR03067 family)